MRRSSSSQIVGYWWPRRKVEQTPKDSPTGPMGKHQQYSLDAADFKPYDPSRDIDFVVPKRLQEVGILELAGNTMISDLQARNNSNQVSGPASSRQYKWIIAQPETPATHIIQLGPKPRFSIHPLPEDFPVPSVLGEEVSSSLEHDSGLLLDAEGKGIMELNADEEIPVPVELEEERDTALVEELPSSSPLSEEQIQKPDSAEVPTQDMHDQALETHIDMIQNPIIHVDELEYPTILPPQWEGQISESSMKELEASIEVQEDTAVSKKIHILGMGAVGQYVAHTLAGLVDPPEVTLLMHRPLLMQKWHDNGAAITIFRDGQLHTRAGFNIESSADFQVNDPYRRFPGFGPNLEHSAKPPRTVIDTLIVTTKPNATVAAVMAIKSRLRLTSTIYFVDDGMGIIDKMNESVFPDPNKRPAYILGSISHKIYPSSFPFTIIEQQQGSLTCSKMPRFSASSDPDCHYRIRRVDQSWTPQATYLVKTLARAAEFNTGAVPRKEYFKAQLQNTAINAVLGPLSVMFDCSNHLLLSNFNATLVMRSVLQEICSILELHPELQNVPHFDNVFSTQKLEAIIVSIIKRTGDNLTTMLQDVRAGRRTDIDFYNGYFIKFASDIGIPCPVNKALLDAVKGKQRIRQKELDLYIPFHKKK